MSAPHCSLGPEACPECWFEGIGPGRDKPEKPLSQCIEGLLRYTAEAWKVERLAARARVVERHLAEARQ